MKYAAEMSSGDTVYIPSFIKIGSGTEKVLARAHRQHCDRIILLSFYQNKESRLNA
jgi:hypothetical protein